MSPAFQPFVLRALSTVALLALIAPAISAAATQTGSEEAARIAGNWIGVARCRPDGGGDYIVQSRLSLAAVGDGLDGTITMIRRHERPASTDVDGGYRPGDRTLVLTPRRKGKKPGAEIIAYYDDTQDALFAYGGSLPPECGALVLGRDNAPYDAPENREGYLFRKPRSMTVEDCRDLGAWLASGSQETAGHGVGRFRYNSLFLDHDAMREILGRNIFQFQAGDARTFKKLGGRCKVLLRKSREGGDQEIVAGIRRGEWQIGGRSGPSELVKMIRLQQLEPLAELRVPEAASSAPAEAKAKAKAAAGYEALATAVEDQPLEKQPPEVGCKRIADWLGLIDENFAVLDKKTRKRARALLYSDEVSSPVFGVPLYTLHRTKRARALNKYFWNCRAEERTLFPERPHAISDFSWVYSDFLKGTFPPKPEFMASIRAIGEARQKIKRSTEAIEAMTASPDASTYDQAARLVAENRALARQLPPAEEKAFMEKARAVLAMSAEIAVDEERQAMENLGSGINALNAGRAWWERFVRRFELAADEVPVRDLPKLHRLLGDYKALRATHLEQARPAILDQIRDATSLGQLATLESTYLWTFRDKKSAAGQAIHAAVKARHQAILAALANEQRRLEMERRRFSFSEREFSLIDEAGRMHVPDSYTAPSAEEIRFASMRALANQKFGGAIVDPLTVHYPVQNELAALNLMGAVFNMNIKAPGFYGRYLKIDKQPCQKREAGGYRCAYRLYVQYETDEVFRHGMSTVTGIGKSTVEKPNGAGERAAAGLFDLANLLTGAPQRFCWVLENDFVLTSDGWQSPTERRRLAEIAAAEAQNEARENYDSACVTFYSKDECDHVRDTNELSYGTPWPSRVEVPKPPSCPWQGVPPYQPPSGEPARNAE